MEMGQPLPPLTRQFPKWSRTGLLRLASEEMTRRQEVKKPATELAPGVGTAAEIRNISQLQENIRFLQAKHQIMLGRLHDEVDILRQKNRDLQFQLVFSKNNSSSISNDDDTTDVKSPSKENETASPKEDTNGDTYKKRCIQLEKELTATKAALQTSLARNAALQALLQKHKIPEIPWIQQQCGHASNMNEVRAESVPDTEDAGKLQGRLDEAERLVKRLRAETDEQRRELQSIKASLSAGGRGNGGGGRGGGGHRPGPLHQRFPPLQSTQQPFWQQQQGPSQQREGNDFQVWNRGHRRNNDKVDSGIHGVGVNTGLPDLRGNPQGAYNNGNINNGQNQNISRRGMGNHGYNNHYYRNSERGYRGGEPRNYRDEDQQHKNYNTPADLSEGETEENTRNNSYKHKRGQNKHQDKS